MLQVSPGVYNETALRSLDWVLWRAAQRGLYVVLSLTDNWKYYNGIDQVGGFGRGRAGVRWRVLPAPAPAARTCSLPRAAWAPAFRLSCAYAELHAL